MKPEQLAAFAASVLAIYPASAFPWASNGAPSAAQVADQPPSYHPNISLSSLLQAGARRSALYQLALTELQELEAEPLCHRVAARLLVNNCQLLEGKDDATVHTDSGRSARDFVDSYAASLAICDLERASFPIPPACALFREPALSRIPLSDAAQLHVPESQIRACLAGLGESPSAWNTWVSYSHKAVRFCEAARADHEKTQNILVFQKLTRTMAKLTDDVKADLQQRIEAWELLAKQTDDRLSQSIPAANLVWERLREIEGMVDSRLASALGLAESSAEHAARSTETLQHLLALTVKTALEGNSQLAFAHQQAMAQFSDHYASDMSILSSQVMAAVDSTAVLHEKLDNAHLQADNLASRQGHLEKGLEKMSKMTETLSTSLDGHRITLAQASNRTSDILDALEATASASAAIQQSYVSRSAAGGWWPYFACPVISIVMGSYGLPPSILRNFGLFAFGEAVGLFYSYASHLSRATHSISIFSQAHNNGTSAGL